MHNKTENNMQKEAQSPELLEGQAAGTNTPHHVPQLTRSAPQAASRVPAARRVSTPDPELVLSRYEYSCAEFNVRRS